MSAELAIRAAIADRGPITFADFMYMALYGPGGYYRSGSPISASGDYFTSPAAHPTFGALLGVQLEEMWRLLGEPTEFVVVEEGAGNGGLAADVVEFAAEFDLEFATALQYVALDIAPPQEQHYPVLPLTETPTGITGCILSNELLDAMPVHRFEVRDETLKEIFVTFDGERFVELLQPPSTPLIGERVGPFLPRLPDGYRGEVNTGLGAWADRQAGILERGWVMAIDYGFRREELYKPERTTGSLRTYYQHTLGQDPLQNPGKQDITAHVDFTAVDEAMAAAGFGHAGLTTQRDFLSNLGIRSMLDQRGARALIDPSGLGKFVVTVYGPDARLGGFNPDRQDDFEPLWVPPFDPRRHIDLSGPGGMAGGHFEVGSLEDLFDGNP